MNYLVGPYYTRSVDSEYIYFISGLSLAQGNFFIGHIDNPATPLQYLVAIVFKVVYLLRNPALPIAQDAITNSELYLKIANLSYIIVVASFLFTIGLSVLKRLENLPLSILIQTTPFISELTIDNLPRFAPETFLLVPILIMTVLILCNKESQFDNREKRLANLFGIIMGFGLSIKLTLLPLGLLPLFYLKKHKKRYALISFLSFFIFAFPVTLQLDKFYFWIRKLILHSGQHGNGDHFFINPETFFTNIHRLFEANTFFFYIIILFTISFGISILKRNNNLLKINASIFTIILLTLFMVGRQFEYRYFILALYLFPLIIFMTFENLLLFFPFRYQKQTKNILILITAVFITFNQLSKISIKTKQIEPIVVANRETQQFIQSLPKKQMRIIASNYSGNTYKAYAMMFTGAYAGSSPNKQYKPLLKKMYPNTYLYHVWDHSFHQWGEELQINEETPDFIVYLPDIKLKDQFFIDLQPHIQNGVQLNDEVLFRNDKNGNAIIHVSIDQNKNS